MLIQLVGLWSDVSTQQVRAKHGRQTISCILSQNKYIVQVS